MKFYTKEWYQACQCTTREFEETKETEVFSEEYFQQVFDEQLQQDIDDSQQWEREMQEDVSYTLPPAMIEAMRKSLMEGVEHCAEYEVRHLPQEIVEKVADPRVFVLGKASKEVVKLMDEHCRENKKLLEKTAEDYSAYVESSLTEGERALKREISFHDFYVDRVEEEEEKLTIFVRFPGSGPEDEWEWVSFYHYKVIKQEEPLEGAIWLYEELHKVGEKQEWHILFNGDLDFIIQAERVEYYHIPWNELNEEVLW